MELFMAFLLFGVGILLIVKGGDFFVDAAEWVSDVTGISKVVIGATLVSFATTAPEYSVSIIGFMRGYTDMAVGNAVGSMNVNLGVALALIAVFAGGAVKDRMFGLRGLIMIVSAAALLFFSFNGVITVPEALILMALFGVYTFVNIRYSKDGESHAKKPTNARDIVKNVLKFVGGAAGIVVGSNLIVENGKFAATHFGVPEVVIGLTFVAIGTSLPEIVTSVAAIVKKQNALSIGNIFGSNILVGTLVLATGAFMTGGLAVPRYTPLIDLPAALLLMAVAVIPSAIGKKMYRWQGILLMAIFVSYMTLAVIVN